MAGWGEAVNTALNLGGLGLALAITILVVVALIRGDLVPGYVFRNERDRADKAEARLDEAKARDAAAQAAAEVAERAALAVVGLQRASDRSHTHEPS